MSTLAKYKNLDSLVLASALLISLSLTPYFTYDVVNPIKFFFLVTFAGLALGVIYFLRDSLKDKKYHFSLCLILLFFFTLVLSYAFSSGNKLTQFYGVHGRVTGFATYFSLAILWLAAVLSSTSNSISKFYKTLIVTSVLSSTYGTLQLLDLDPLPWTSDDSWIVGTFANPNFFSSFLGFTNIFVFSLIINKNLKNSHRGIATLYFAYLLFLLYRIDSTQGFLVILAGVAVQLFLLIRFSPRLKKLQIPYVAVILTMTFGFFLDILQKAPWQSVLYKNTVSVRGDFWRGALRIVEDNFWVGVGFDGFRNWYPRYRDIASLEHGEAESMTDAAHNVFLDMAVNGGVILFMAYLFLTVATLFSIVRIVKRSAEIDFMLSGIIGVWIGYQAQSLISINHLGLAIWGWLSSALIIGLEIHTRTDSKENLRNTVHVNAKNIKTGRIAKNLKNRKPFMPVLIGGLIGMLVGLPILNVNMKMHSALKAGSPIHVIEAAKLWPQDGLRMSLAADIVTQMGFPKDGYKLAVTAARFDPDFSVPWKYIATFPRISDEEKNKVNRKLDVLDPLFRDYQRSLEARKKLEGK